MIETLNRDHATEKFYLFGLGLNAAFIATGAYLTARGNAPPESEQLIGTGKSIMLQGAVLFVFDAVVYAIHVVRRTGFTAALGGDSE